MNKTTIKPKMIALFSVLTFSRDICSCLWLKEEVLLQVSSDFVRLKTVFPFNRQFFVSLILCEFCWIKIEEWLLSGNFDFLEFWFITFRSSLISLFKIPSCVSLTFSECDWIELLDELWSRSSETLEVLEKGVLLSNSLGIKFDFGFPSNWLLARISTWKMQIPSY